MGENKSGNDYRDKKGREESLPPKGDMNLRGSSSGVVIILIRLSGANNKGSVSRSTKKREGQTVGNEQHR